MASSGSNPGMIFGLIFTFSAAGLQMNVTMPDIVSGTEHYVRLKHSRPASST